MNHHFKLCLVTHIQGQSFQQYQEFLVQALEGGITLLQLRDKSKSLSELYVWAQQLKALLKPFNVPLIINDHVDLAIAVDADGVHLGQGDISPQEARRLLGKDKIIGWSLESLDQLAFANAMTEIDYLAASAVFPSLTKRDCKTIWGLEGLKQLSAQSLHPVMAIGGIDAGNVESVMQNGACGVAVVSAIHDHPNPKQATQEILCITKRVMP